MGEKNIFKGFRLAHTMLRVLDLDSSLQFYCDILGMKVLRKTDYPEGKFTNTFIGYGPEDTYPTLELTYNWDQKEPYEKGNGWGHICIETPDVYKACEDLSSAGIKITRPPGPMKHGTRVIAFCEDPDGYKVELNEKIESS
ncbi:MAG: Lactoylglutathione lyase [Alphaproteobacteria bacterium MarineAlpha5_Bin5]|nr:MAG: Lactoylglutathione lyase [Alphaproteobacteria bacterium MarineAlpha5_Bin5]|tara:strand:- start:2316 stop:2738 length:423 start_codon:yes stop_codon:yes gene_type:complete